MDLDYIDFCLNTTFFRDFGLTLLWGGFDSRRMKTCNGHMNYELSPCAQKIAKKDKKM